MIWLGTFFGKSSACEGYELFDTWKLHYVTNILGLVKSDHPETPKKKIIIQKLSPLKHNSYMNIFFFGEEIKNIEEFLC